MDTSSQALQYFCTGVLLLLTTFVLSVVMADAASSGPVGLVRVTFPTPEEAASATTKHMQRMKERSIKVLPATPAGVGRVNWVVKV